MKVSRGDYRSHAVPCYSFESPIQFEGHQYKIIQPHRSQVRITLDVGMVHFTHWHFRAIGLHPLPLVRHIQRSCFLLVTAQRST
jgi:hypothetical protein